MKKGDEALMVKEFVWGFSLGCLVGLLLCTFGVGVVYLIASVMRAFS